MGYVIPFNQSLFEHVSEWKEVVLELKASKCVDLFSLQGEAGTPGAVGVRGIVGIPVSASSN